MNAFNTEGIRLKSYISYTKLTSLNNEILLLYLFFHNRVNNHILSTYFIIEWLLFILVNLMNNATFT